MAVIREHGEAGGDDGVLHGVGEARFGVEERRLEVLDVHEEVLSGRVALIAQFVIPTLAIVVGAAAGVPAGYIALVGQTLPRSLQHRRVDVHVRLPDLVPQSRDVIRGGALRLADDVPAVPSRRREGRLAVGRDEHLLRLLGSAVGIGILDRALRVLARGAGDDVRRSLLVGGASSPPSSSSDVAQCRDRAIRRSLVGEGDSHHREDGIDERRARRAHHHAGGEREGHRRRYDGEEDTDVDGVALGRGVDRAGEDGGIIILGLLPLTAVVGVVRHYLVVVGSI
mmetsp:Transcript_20830/g.50083  ORF Transcript_20830/g.50083 Transcript_20830/m.50083 type:complete len:283 (+) Transcript_20830:907-1755(+)